MKSTDHKSKKYELSGNKDSDLGCELHTQSKVMKSSARFFSKQPLNPALQAFIGRETSNLSLGNCPSVKFLSALPAC